MLLMRVVEAVLNPANELLVKYTVEILYTATALTSNVNVECSNIITSSDINVTVNSEFLLK